jgi:hypothetical protein
MTAGMAAHSRASALSQPYPRPAALSEHEMTDHDRRGMKPCLAEAQPPAGKMLATFNFENVPIVASDLVVPQRVGRPGHLQR